MNWPSRTQTFSAIFFFADSDDLAEWLLVIPLWARLVRKQSLIIGISWHGGW